MILALLVLVAECGAVDVNELRVVRPALVNAPHQVDIDGGVICNEQDGKPLRAEVCRPNDAGGPLPQAGPVPPLQTR